MVSYLRCRLLLHVLLQMPCQTWMSLLERERAFVGEMDGADVSPRASSVHLYPASAIILLPLEDSLPLCSIFFMRDGSYAILFTSSHLTESSAHEPFHNLVGFSTYSNHKCLTDKPTCKRHPCIPPQSHISCRVVQGLVQMHLLQL